MSFPATTILARRTPEDSPLDHITVIGNSPIRTQRAGEWAGETGDDVIVQPIDTFTGPLTVPQSVLDRDYDIEYIPDEGEIVSEDRRVARGRIPLVAPEEQFRRAALAQKAGTAEVQTTSRARTKIKA